MKISILVAAAVVLASATASAQTLQFCVYNKYGQRHGGCYMNKQSCESVVASYNKSNASMGQFCQPEKK